MLPSARDDETADDLSDESWTTVLSLQVRSRIIFEPPWKSKPNARIDFRYYTRTVVFFQTHASNHCYHLYLAAKFPGSAMQSDADRDRFSFLANDVAYPYANASNYRYPCS